MKLRALVSLLAALLLFGGEPALARPQAEWRTARPETVGVDQAALAQLAADVRAGRYSNIHSVLVVRRGRLVMEEYFAGEDERRGQPIGRVQFDAETLHDVRSVTKSVTSILMGIAIAQGKIPGGVEAPALDFFPEYADLRTPERQAIRLRHLLTMTAGLEWDEHSRPYSDPRNSEREMDAAPDPVRYVLERPIVAPPGARFEYSGGNTAVLARIIERSVGKNLDAYAEEVLFRPLGIARHEWLTDQTGAPLAASGLRLRPRDMAKLGLLYLNDGRWRGRQIVPQDWVRASLSPHIVVSERPTGFQRYGYQWWLGTARRGEESVAWSCAVGWGGQRILLVPSEDMVVVITAGMYGDPRQTDLTFEIMLDRILPAVR